MANITYIIPESYEIVLDSVLEPAVDDLMEILTTASDPVSLIEHFATYYAPQGADTIIQSNRVLEVLDAAEIPVGPAIIVEAGAVLSIGD